MANELAAEYVSIVPTGTAIGPGLRKLFTGKAVRDAGAAGGKTAGAGIAKGVGDSSNRTGRAMAIGLGGGAALAAVGIKKAVDKAGDFQSQMIQVGTQLDVSGAGLKDLSALAIEMGNKTVFSAQDASDAMLELAKGGLSQAQIKAGGLSETLTLATAGGLELGAAATYVSNGIAAFGLKASDAARITTAFAGAANSSTASVESIGLGMAQVGPIAHLMGASIEDTAGALAAFDSAGLKGADAGTSLKTMLTRLIPTTTATVDEFKRLGLMSFDAASAYKFLESEGIKPLGRSTSVLTKQMQDYAMKSVGAKTFTAKAQKEFVRLGTATGAVKNQFFDAAGNMKSMADVAQILQNSLRGQTKEQKLATLSTLFGSDASRAAAILQAKGSAGLAKYMKATRDKTQAEKLAASATAGYKGAMEGFKGSIETVQIQVGTYFLPILEKLLRFGSGTVLPWISKMIERLGPKLGKSFSTAGRAVRIFTAAFKDPDVTSDGWVGMVERIASSTRHAFDTVKKVAGSIDLSSIWDGIKRGISGISDLVKGVDWSQLTTAIHDFSSGTGSIDFGGLTTAARAFGDVFAFLGRHMDLVQKAVPFLVAGFVALKVAQAANSVIGRDSLVGFGLQLGTTIALTLANRSLAKSYSGVTVAQKQAAGASSLTTLGYIRQAAAAVAHRVAMVAGAVATKAMAAGQRVLNLVMRANPIGLLITGILLLVGGLIYAYKHSETFRKIVDAAFRGIKAVALSVLSWLTKAVKSAIDFVKRHWQTILSILGGPLALAVILIVKHWGSIKSAFRAAKDWVVGAFRRGWALTRAVLIDPVLRGRDRIRELMASAQAKFQAVKDWAVRSFKRGWSALTSILKDPIGAARTAISAILGAGPKGLRSVFSRAVSAIGSIWDRLRDKAKAPIRFVVNTVLEKGILAAFRKVAGLVGLDSLASKMHVSLPPGFAAGGYTGAGGKYDAAGIVHRGEMVFEQERVNKLGVGPLEDLRKGRARIVPGFAGGGLVGSLVGGAGAVLRFLTNPADALKKVLAQLLSGAEGTLDSSVGQVVKAIPGKLVGGIVDKLRAAFSGGGVAGSAGLFAGSLLNAGRRFGANPIYPHVDPQGGSAYDYMMNVPKGRDLAANLVKWRQNYGVRYVIHNMRIWSPVNWAGRPYTPISTTGDFRHTSHVHASYGNVGGYAAGTMNARRGLAWVGERGPELVRFRGGEQVYPTGSGSGGGPLVNIEKVTTQDPRELSWELDRLLRRREVLGQTRGGVIAW